MVVVAVCGVMASERTRLDDALERRRVELRMSWRDVTREAGMSNEGLRAIRRGERRPTAVTKARIEDALRWKIGRASCRERV